MNFYAARLGPARPGSARPGLAWHGMARHGKGKTKDGGKVGRLKTVAEKSKESVLLENFLGKQNPGAELSFLAIEAGSGVRMDADGKNCLRRALHRLRIEYTAIRGYGVTLANSSLVMPILTNRLTRIDSAVKRGDRTQKNLEEQFFKSLSDEQQKSVLFAGAIFGAIRLASRQGRYLYGKRREDAPVAMTLHIELPKFD